MNRAATGPAVPSFVLRRRARVGARLREGLLPASGLTAVGLTSFGMSGVGDAPDPHESAALMALHFVRHRDDILGRAPFGQLGAVLLFCFSVGLANLLRDRSAGRRDVGAHLGVAAAGLALASYFAFLQLDYTSIAYDIARTSPVQVKAMFEPTILATPLLAIVTSALLWTSAVAAWRSYRLPRLWCLGSAVAGIAPVVGIFGHGDSGWLYPDVQQQICGNIALTWVALTAVVVLTTTRRR